MGNFATTLYVERSPAVNVLVIVECQMFCVISVKVLSDVSNIFVIFCDFCFFCKFTINVTFVILLLLCRDFCHFCY